MRYPNFSQAIALTSGVLAVCFLNRLHCPCLDWTHPSPARREK